jgi:quercetin dioxygenase-like cupin family protein
MKRSAMAGAVSMMTLLVVLSAGTLALSAATNPQASATQSTHVMVTPGDLKWTDGPPSLAAGSKAAVIEGDPKNPGLFTMRLKLPANYKIPPHWHPADEHVTVISGTFNMGLGDTFDESKGNALPVGSFAVMPAKANHFAFTKDETVIQLHGMGPWSITYVNPKDDPRMK